MQSGRPRVGQVPEELKRRLDAVHGGLLLVHKALVDFERTRFEKAGGHIENAGAFLQALIHDPWFAWLRPISELAVQIDEYVSSKTPVNPADGQALVDQACRLLVPNADGDDFARKYDRALQASPEVIQAHGKWKQIVAG